MPQMFPMNWIILMFFFIMIFLLYNIILYFNFLKKINIKNLNKFIMLKYFNWKW